jgi:DNA-binding transcriptional LysR family regulator
MIDAELYRVFFTVGGCGTISEAAGRLFVSQPAVSKSIKKLEDLTGCTLFVRSSKGVRLTTEGQILYDYVEKGFEHLQNGEQVMKKIRNKGQGLVKVGISNTLCRYYFIPHLEEFHRKFPGIRITIVNRTSQETLKLLEKGLIDFGIISIPQDRSQFTYREVLTVHDVFVTGRRYPELQAPVPLQTLSRYPVMMLEKDNVTRSYIDAYLAENQVGLQPELEIGSMDFLIEFAKIGLGIALVIKNFVEEELSRGVLYEVPVAPAMPPRKVGIVMPKNLPISIAAETFIHSIAGSTKNNTDDS